MLDKLTGSFNGSTRVPLEVHRPTDRDAIGVKVPARPRQSTPTQRPAHRGRKDQA
jgi:hypothetical protein